MLVIRPAILCRLYRKDATMFCFHHKYLEEGVCVFMSAPFAVHYLLSYLVRFFVTGVEDYYYFFYPQMVESLDYVGCKLMLETSAETTK